MNKILRYSFVALLAMVGLNVMADTDVTFTLNDPDAITALGITLPASGQGTKIESISKDGVTITATTAAGKTDTRIYQGSGKNAGKYDFRVYTDGTLTFTAASNNIKKIVITGTGSMDKLSRDGYTVSDDKQTGTWEGDAQTVTLTATGTATIYTITVTYGASTETRTATTINFAEGYQTQIAKGPDGMFPEIGSSVALPTATVMAGDAAVAGANIEWSLEVKSWKEKSEGELPILKEGRISFEGHGVVSVKAAFAGNDAYQPSSKSYTLTIYNSYGLLKEMANDIADPDCTKDDEDDKDGSPVFYFFRNVDVTGFPVATSTVTYANGKYIYLTDGEGANLLFYGTNSQNLKQGDVISGNVSETNLGGFWGNLKRYNKLPEFVFTDMNVKVESEGAAVAPTTITVDQLKDYINAYVKVENAEFVSADGKNLTFKVGETNLAVYNQFNVDATALEATAKYTIVGMGCVYKKSSADAVYQLYPISFTKAAEETTTDQVWDFTKWSAETVANLIADAAASKTEGWSDVEKTADATAGAEPTDEAKNNCFWFAGTVNEDGSLSANGAVIKELKGLKFDSDYAAKRSLAIAVNYPSTTLGDYAGGAYLWLGGGGSKQTCPCFTIPGVKAGSKITVELESHKPSDGRGIGLYKNSYAAENLIGEQFKPTAKEAKTWEIAEDCDVVVWNTSGCHIYTLKVEAGSTGISTVKAQKTQNNVIYNLAGQKVNAGYKGVVIMNGKKMLQK